MVDRGCVGKRPLCKSQVNSKNTRVSQTIDWMKEVIVKAALTILIQEERRPFRYFKIFS